MVSWRSQKKVERVERETIKANQKAKTKTKVESKNGPVPTVLIVETPGRLATSRTQNPKGRLVIWARMANPLANSNRLRVEPEKGSPKEKPTKRVERGAESKATGPDQSQRRASLVASPEKARAKGRAQ